MRMRHLPWADFHAYCKNITAIMIKMIVTKVFHSSDLKDKTNNNIYVIRTCPPEHTCQMNS